MEANGLDFVAEEVRLRQKQSFFLIRYADAQTSIAEVNTHRREGELHLFNPLDDPQTPTMLVRAASYEVFKNFSTPHRRQSLASVHVLVGV